MLGSISMNLARIVAIAVNVFREVIRDRILYLLAIYFLVLIGAVTLVPNLAPGAGNKITLDVGLAAMHVIGLLVAVFVGTGLINKEIEKRTVLVLMAKPMSRTEFITGKHLGLSLVLAVLIGAMGVLYLGALTLLKVPFPVPSILAAMVYMLLELWLLTAIAIAFGVFTSSLLATLFTFGVFLMGHLSQDLLTFGQLTKNPGLAQAMQNLYLVLPDLERFNLKNQAVYGLLPDNMTLLSSAVYGVAYIGMSLAIATFIFSKREF
jgi:Cu-processing system permease protein